jgi:protein TonB
MAFASTLAINPIGLAPAGAARRPALPLPMDRRLLIVTAVVGLHLLGLWALHAGLLRRAVELVISVQVVAEIVEPPQPVVTPAPPAPPTPTPRRLAPPVPPAPRQQPPRQPAVRPAPQPVAIPAPEPAPQAPAAVPALQPVINTAPPATEVAMPAPPAPPRVDLPSSSADYLNNPPPPYPPLSKRLGEQGRVVVRARIEVNGSASQAEIRTSSGYERLDQAALQTVKRWRYLPGKRAGVPEAMWFNIPIQFVLE